MRSESRAGASQENFWKRILKKNEGLQSDQTRAKKIKKEKLSGERLEDSGMGSINEESIERVVEVTDDKRLIEGLELKKEKWIEQELQVKEERGKESMRMKSFWD